MSAAGTPATASQPTGRVFYGWYVVGACNLVAFVTWGVGVWNQGVFLAYYAERFGWSTAALSVAAAMFNVCAGLVGLALGRVIDRVGPRRVLLGGAAVLAAAAVTLGHIHELWQLYPTFLLYGTGYALLHTVTLGAIVGRWFVRNRARAMAAAIFGGAFGGTVLAPLNGLLLDRGGAEAAGFGLAAVVLLAVVPGALWVIRDRPESLGLVPDGGTPVGDGAAPAAEAEPAWTTGQALRTRAFRVMAGGFCCVMVAQLGFLAHQVLFLRGSFGFAAAAAVVGVTTVGSAVGRTAMLLAGSRWPVRVVTAATLGVQAAGLAVSAVGGAEWALVLGSLLVGLTTGVVVTVQPVMVTEAFGRAAYGRVYGAFYLIVQLGQATGPLLYGLVTTGWGYRPVLAGAAAVVAVAAFALHGVQTPAPPSSPERSAAGAT